MSRLRAIQAVALAWALCPAMLLAQSLPGAPREGWARYEVPLVEGQQGPCCHSIHEGVVQQRGCDLDRRGGITIQGDGMHDDAGGRHDDALVVYLHHSAGRIDDVQAFGSSCPVRADAEPVPLAAVAPADSVALLARLAGGERDKAGEGAMVALAQHAGDGATQALVRLSGKEHSTAARRDALFWLGQSRGVAGAEAVLAVARSDEPAKLREHAVFSLSQNEDIDSFAALAQIAREDPVPRVRGQALFWMAQGDDPRAADAILAAMREDPSEKVREQGVFALSQLDGGRGDRALIGIVRGDYPRKMKKEALFWLAQSGSAEALEFIDATLGAR